MINKQERNNEIVKLFRDGLTHQEIATMFNITRERVRQILVKELGGEKMTEIVKKNIKQRRDILAKEREILFICQNCNKEFTGKYVKRRFCGRVCFKKFQRTGVLTVKQRKEKKKEYMRNYYYKKLKLK